MERILVTGGTKIGQAGVATMIYRWGQEFNNQKLVYDYLMQSELPKEKYRKKIIDKGGRIYHMKGKKNAVSILKWVTEICEKYHYQTIHINSDSSYIAAAYIMAARRGGVKNIIVHSHCSQIDETNPMKRVMKILAHQVFKPYVLKFSKYYLSCSDEAGIWMYGKKGITRPQYGVIPTSERVDDFEYKEEERKAFRKEMDIENKIVIGNIGRFSFQKNHDFMIDLFAEFHNRHRDSFLLLVGKGPTRKKIEEKVKLLELQDSVLFLQDRDDTQALYSAMDIFLMTSLFEGMPSTIVEAQMSFLPCVVSDAVTHDVKFTRNVTFVKGWEQNVWIEVMEREVGGNRNQNKKVLYDSDFNISNAARKLAIYLVSE